MSRANYKNLEGSKNLKDVELSDGLWNIYKPKGVTSFDVVRKIKWMTGEKKVGHAGTLDPLAEGVLVIGIGRDSTKKLRFVLEEDKEYIAEIKLGMSSTTDDEEGAKSTPCVKGVENSKDENFRGVFQEGIKNKIEQICWPNLAEIKKVTKTFIGDIIQISPVYSAIKIDGERAYKKARRGEKFTQPPRVVTIKEIEILDYQLKNFKEIRQKDNDTIPAGKYPVLKIKCIVGSGTYIRSLAREIGEKLKTSGYLISLTRTSIGDYKIEDAVKLN